MKEISLFPDQLRLIEGVRASMRRHKRVLMQAATGAGKTVMGAYMIKGARTKRARSIFMVPRRELLRQTAETFNEYDIPFSYVSAGHHTNPYAQTFLATTGSLANRMHKLEIPQVIFVDETHFGSEQLETIINYFAERGAWVIGLSATPKKTNGDGLDHLYDDMVCGESIAWLIENKRLSDYRLFSPSRPAHLEKIKSKNGEYVRSELSDMMEHDRMLIGDAVKHYKQHAMGRLNVAYTTSRKHNEMVAQEFRDQGISAMAVDGETPDDELKRIIRAFAKREIKTLCSCDLLTFGFDLKSSSGGIDVTIESMSDLAPTQSEIKQMQKWGRPMRYKDYPAMLFDHAGNAMRPNGQPHHGLPDDEREWKLEGSIKGSGDGERALPIKQCNGGFKTQERTGDKIKPCFFTHRPAPRCPNCGAWYEVESRIPDQIDVDLQEFQRQKREPPTAEDYEKMKETIKVLTERGIKKGMPKFAAEKWAMQQAAKRLSV